MCAFRSRCLMAVATTAALSLFALLPCSADVPNPTPVHLGALPGDLSSRAHGINAAGQIVGESYLEEAGSTPFIWQNGVMTALPGPTGACTGTAEGINGSGQIVGACSVQAADGQWYTQACLWTPAADGWTLEVLSSPAAEYAACVAYKINGAGQVLAVAEKWDDVNWTTVEVGCIWSGASWRLLMDGETPLIPGQMNERGQVLARKSNGQLVLWDNGTVTPIAPNADYASMNNLGQVVCASCDTQSNGYVSYIYLPEGAYGLEAGLHTLPEGQVAAAINDAGLIASYRDVMGCSELVVGRIGEAPLFTYILPGEVWSQLILNANGEVTGLLNTTSGLPAGFYAGPTGVVMLEGYVTAITDMNDSGMIIGGDNGQALLWDVASALDISVASIVRTGAKTVTVTVNMANKGAATAYNVSVNAAQLDGSATNSLLPLVFGAIRPGTSKQCKLQFKSPSSGSQTLTIQGTSSLGGLFTIQTVTVPGL